MQQATPAGGDHWSSKFTFIMAAIGSAVGLGNLWRFPYQAGENGGGAFILVYVICILLIGLPVLAAELMIGRRGAASAPESVARLARADGAPTAWAGLAIVGMVGAFLILSFYSVIAGWVMGYIVIYVAEMGAEIAATGPGALLGGAFPSLTPEEVTGQLTDLFADPGRQILYHAIFMALTVFIVARGLKGGIESAVTILMPAFFVMLVLLVLFGVSFSISKGAFTESISFLFNVRFDQLMPKLADGSILGDALGQAFFSIGLGSALMMTYGSYLNRDTDIGNASRNIAIADTAVAIIAGLAIFPIVFAVGLDPAGGPALLFQTLPLAFQQMPGGATFGFLFFVLAIFAALTSSISLLEASVAYANDLSGRNHRALVAIGLGLVAFVVGLATVFSFNVWADQKPLNFIPLFNDQTWFGVIDELTGKIMLPLAGFLTCVFAGWVVSSSAAREELGFRSQAWFDRWRFLVRWVCPIAVGAVLVYGSIIAPALAG